MDANDRLNLLDSVSTLKKSIYTDSTCLQTHTMRTTSRIRINEHDSAEELSSYTESDSPIIEKESPVIKRESSPWFPPSKIMDEKVESKKKGERSLPLIILSSS